MSVLLVYVSSRMNTEMKTERTNHGLRRNHIGLTIITNRILWSHMTSMT